MGKKSICLFSVIKGFYFSGLETVIAFFKIKEIIGILKLGKILGLVHVCPCSLVYEDYIFPKMYFIFPNSGSKPQPP